MKRSNIKRRVMVFVAGIASGLLSLIRPVGLHVASGVVRVRAWVTEALRNGDGRLAPGWGEDEAGLSNYAAHQADVARDSWVDGIIDERNETVMVEGYQYEPSETLYNNDPVAYRDKVLELRDTQWPDPAA